MSFLVSIAALLAALVSTNPANAQPMEILFAGDVELSTEVLLPLFDGVRAGDPFWGRILFDSDAPEWCTANPNSCGPAAADGIYRGASMTVAVGGVGFTWSSVSIGVYNDGVFGWPTVDRISLRGSESLEGLRGGIELSDFTGSAIDSGRLPITLELDDWGLRQLIVSWSDPLLTQGGDPTLSWELTSLVLRPVPEPSVVGLIAFALVGLAAARSAR